MKKAIPLLFSILLPSCNSQPLPPIPLLRHEASLMQVDGDDVFFAWDCSDSLEDMIAKKASFLVFVYVPGCGTCELFTKEVDAFLSKTGILLPSCLVGDFREATGSRVENSSLVVFRKGERSSFFDLTKSEGTVSDFIEDNAVLTDVNVLSSTYVSDYPTAFYPLYKMSASTQEIDSPLSTSPFCDNDPMAAGKRGIYISLSRCSDFSAFGDFPEQGRIDFLVSIDEDLDKMSNSDFYLRYGFEKSEAEFGFTYVDYSSDTLFSSESLDGILQFIDLG